VNNLGLHGEAGINPGIFVAAVDDASAKLKVQIRADNESRVSTFRKVPISDPIYRRFNTTKEGATADDTPDTVRFYTTGKEHMSLFENQGNLVDQHRFWTNPDGYLSLPFEGKKQYLGLVDGLANEEIMVKKNVHTGIYVDTAYVNRGTGLIKPQYMLAVRPEIYQGGLGCDNTGEATIPLLPYVKADYLINAYDSAHLSNGRLDDDYLWDGRWERMVFTKAIHAKDMLYILNGVDLSDIAKYKDLVYTEVKGNGWQLDVNKLSTLVSKDQQWEADSIWAVDLANNKHKDCVFSFRLVERHNPEDFFIESETQDRDVIHGPILRPCRGGWLKIQNGVPIISRADDVDAIGEGTVFNVERVIDGTPVANEEVAAVASVTVTGNTGSVSILNAAGKKVVINNILGQTIVNTVLASDNATVPVPVKGIVVVAVEGQAAVKEQVK
jgi:hypothetical protein